MVHLTVEIYFLSRVLVNKARIKFSEFWIKIISTSDMVRNINIEPFLIV